MSKITIDQLAKYGLDYVGLVSGSSMRGKPINTGLINKQILSIEDFLHSNGKRDLIQFDLVTDIDDEYDTNIPNEEKSDEQKQAEKKLDHHRKILSKIKEIDAKIRVDGYTKRMVVQTGFIFFEIASDESKSEKYVGPLIQFEVSNIDMSFSSHTVKISLSVPNNRIEIMYANLKKYTQQNVYSQIFDYITSMDAKGETDIPVKEKTVVDLWSFIRGQLLSSGVKGVIDKPNFDNFVISISPKANHFLAEDLDAIAKMDPEELAKTSLGTWVSNEDSDIEKEVFDDGSTEIFFPFSYDKSQLKVLGITENKASVVEGPPGTGKSQTIANLLTHFAATGSKVLFVSQKDQAIRGVKDKLKTLDIPFMFGYIPDKTSPLYTQDDEKDSAATTLSSIDSEHRKGIVGDIGHPLKIIDEDSKKFAKSIELDRSLYDLIETLKNLRYVEVLYAHSVNKEWYDDVVILNEQIFQAKSDLKTVSAKSEDQLRAVKDMLRYVELDYSVSLQSIDNIYDYLRNNMPERSNFIAAKINQTRLKSAIKKYGSKLVQEIYSEIEIILFSELTKSQKLHKIAQLKELIRFMGIEENLLVNTVKRANKLSEKGISEDNLKSIDNIISEYGSQKVFDDLEKYSSVKTQISSLKKINPNVINREIKDLKKFYQSNIVNYVRNKILINLDRAIKIKRVRSVLAQVSRSLKKSKNANKTFDKLKHSPENFEAMIDVLPIWMMSLDDVSRILPMKLESFDYVIIDEASQCNFAYAMPAMARAKRVLFFGDSQQMRDSNTMFKSNDNLESIARKNKIPEEFQIKSAEDTVKSVMDIANLNGIKNTSLRYHYRSPAELIGFSNEEFYKKEGRKLEPLNDNILPYKDTGRVLLNHIIEVDEAKETSAKTNVSEAEKIIELIKDIKTDPRLSDKSIAVLTFFNEQAELLRKMIDDKDIKVSIIDGIQGDERDIILYSFVIKDPREKSRYVALTGEGGEIRKDIAAGRVNVAFSRAKLQVHCVTSISPELWPEGIWIKKYLKYVETNGLVSRRHNKDNQHFDSYFEEQVFMGLSKKLDPNIYTIDTQVSSLGFKIDLVVSGNGSKLAIECDGPTHFENGDGQVYVQDDWERQGALESAGWNFYRISYFDWTDNTVMELKKLFSYIKSYFNRDVAQESAIIKKLMNEASVPKEAPKDQYVTKFKSGQPNTSVDVNIQVDNLIKPQAVREEPINHIAFTIYLSERIGKTISIIYKTERKNSDTYWRDLHLEKFDNTYFYVRHKNKDGKTIVVKYLRAKVVNFK